MNKYVTVRELKSQILENVQSIYESIGSRYGSWEKVSYGLEEVIGEFILFEGLGYQNPSSFSVYVQPKAQMLYEVHLLEKRNPCIHVPTEPYERCFEVRDQQMAINLATELITVINLHISIFDGEDFEEAKLGLRRFFKSTGICSDDLERYFERYEVMKLIARESIAHHNKMVKL